jgi:Sec-independent protein translocase protein TatA
MDSITLLGTEKIKDAARTMESAAAEMSRAANQIEEALRQQRVFLTDWLCEFQRTSP